MLISPGILCDSGNSAHRLKVGSFTDLELSSLEAMCAVLTCGKIFDPSGIAAGDGYIYPWLDHLLSCDDLTVSKVAQQTCHQLLRCVM